MQSEIVQPHDMRSRNPQYKLAWRRFCAVMLLISFGFSIYSFYIFQHPEFDPFKFLKIGLASYFSGALVVIIYNRAKINAAEKNLKISNPSFLKASGAVFEVNDIEELVVRGEKAMSIIIVFGVALSGLMAATLIYAAEAEYNEIGYFSDGFILISLFLALLSVLGVLASYFAGIAKNNIKLHKQSVTYFPHKGIVMNEDEISFIPALFIGDIGTNLLKAGKYELKVKWQDVEDIKITPFVRRGDSSRKLVPMYVFRIKGGAFSQELGRDLNENCICVIRLPFYGQEKQLIEAFKRFSKCEIEIKDNIN